MNFVPIPILHNTVSLCKKRRKIKRLKLSLFTRKEEETLQFSEQQVLCHSVIKRVQLTQSLRFHFRKSRKSDTDNLLLDVIRVSSQRHLMLLTKPITTPGLFSEHDPVPLIIINTGALRGCSNIGKPVAPSVTA